MSQEEKEKVPYDNELKKKKDEEEVRGEDKETKQDKEHKEVEELAKELLKKGTLRK